MKHLVLCFLVLTTSLLSAQGIQFFKGSWAEALQEAKRTDKKIFVDVYTTWCKPCRMLDMDVFPNAEVGNFMNASYICFKADAEGGGKHIAQKYEVKSYPTALFVDADETLAGRFTGAGDVPFFMNSVKDIFYRSGNGVMIKAMNDAWKTEAKTSELAYLYMNLLKQAGLDYSTVLDDYVSALPEDSLLLPHNVSMILLNINKLEGKTFETLLAQQSRVPKFANKLKVLLEQHFKQAASADSKKELEKVIDAAKRVYAAQPAMGDLKEGQYRNRFFLETKSLKSFVKHNRTFVPEQMLPVLKKSKPVDSSVFEKYAVELDNIIWQYSQYVDDKDDLNEALNWFESVVELLPAASLRYQYIAQLAHESGDKPKAIRYLELAITQAKQQQQDVAELEKLLGEWR